MSATVRARIGMVNFINTAPLYEVWQRTVHRPDWRITEAAPSRLNALLHRNELDLGFVSSQECAIHPSEYAILDDLSISASGRVQSVCLFSTVELEKLSGGTIGLSPQSQTSNSLVKIILEEFIAAHPNYESRPEFLENGPHGNGLDARLAIGDEALRLAGSDRYPVVLDLSDAWFRHTGLPFVFAVWAVRKQFLADHPDLAAEIHGELRRCIAQGRENLREISLLVAERIPMDPEQCYEYLQGIEYNLGPRKKEALSLFFDYLIKRGEAPAEALPISYCG